MNQPARVRVGVHGVYDRDEVLAALELPSGRVIALCVVCCADTRATIAELRRRGLA